jgi:hypothetical protein
LSFLGPLALLHFWHKPRERGYWKRGYTQRRATDEDDGTEVASGIEVRYIYYAPLPGLEVFE